MDIILATRNPSKAEQIRAIFDGSGFRILTLEEAGIIDEAPENGRSLEANAIGKAFFAWVKAGCETWTMADDTGLFIRALGGLPGVRSSRWAGDGKTTDEITRYTLERMAGFTDRFATFKAVAVVVPPKVGIYRSFEGSLDGHILESAACPPQPKMPYSPIFVPACTGIVWAKMSIAEENAISHRGQAFRQAREFIEKSVATATS